MNIAVLQVTHTILLDISLPDTFVKILYKGAWISFLTFSPCNSVTSNYIYVVLKKAILNINICNII